MSSLIPVIAIIGPTAVGKTRLSLEIAEELKAEIISVDSRQVYRFMDVGTDKVSREVQRQIPHHLIDVVNPDEIFSAADFVSRAHSAVRRIMARGRIPLFIGGTAFYYRALFNGVLTHELPKDSGVREELQTYAEVHGGKALHEWLKKVDPESAQRLHPNDRYRVSRALEIYECTGKTASWWYSSGEKGLKKYNPLYIGLTRPRAELYENIENRVHQQFRSGYPEEVEWLLSRGYNEHFPSMRGFGYRELIDWKRGKISLADAAELDIRATKLFSKRQMTWFKKFSPVLWYDMSVLEFEDIIKNVRIACQSHLEKRF